MARVYNYNGTSALKANQGTNLHVVEKAASGEAYSGRVTFKARQRSSALGVTEMLDCFEGYKLTDSKRDRILLGIATFVSVSLMFAASFGITVM